MHDTDRYVMPDGVTLDVEAIEADAHGVGDWCEACGEPNPCSIAWAADRVGRTRVTRRELSVSG